MSHKFEISRESPRRPLRRLRSLLPLGEGEDEGSGMGNGNKMEQNGTELKVCHSCALLAVAPDAKAPGLGVVAALPSFSSAGSDPFSPWEKAKDEGSGDGKSNEMRLNETK